MHKNNSLTTTPTTRLLAVGLLLCLLFAGLGVYCRGIRWDETYEHAQIITGQVQYPEGHPLRVYVKNTFSLQTYCSALIMHLGGGAALLCGLRNLLFLLASILPVFLLVHILTGRLLWGLAAALLLMQGIMLEFDGSYPTMVWPEIYSNGHIGGGWALITLWALATDRFRLGGFLFALMPAVHMGQWPPLLAFVPCLFLWRWKKGQGNQLKKSIPFLAAGFACCMVFLFIQKNFTELIPTSGRFYDADNVTAIWRSYTFHHDLHRRFPPGNGHLIMVGTLVLTAMAASWYRGKTLGKVYAALALYTAIIAATVWSIMTLHYVLGERTPFLLVAWMPYRLVNHLPPLCLAVMAAIVIHPPATRRHNQPILAMLLLLGLMPLPLSKLMGQEIFSRYLQNGDYIAFYLYGLALATLIGPFHKTKHAHDIAVLFTLASGLAMLFAYHQFGAACVIAGICTYYLAARMPLPLLKKSPHPALITVILIIITAQMLHHQYTCRKSLPVTEFAATARPHVANGKARMVIAPPDTYMLQGQLNCPVLFEAATLSLISYQPQIGPVINQIYHDIYGQNLIPRHDSPPLSWQKHWQQRSVPEWQRLAKTYRFDHIIAPDTIPLPLTPLCSSQSHTLYKITEPAAE